MVNPEIREEVPNEHVRPAESVTEIHQGGRRQTDTDITQHDEVGVLVLKQRGAGVKVVDTTAIAVVLALATSLTLPLVVVVAGDIGEQVVGPADKLLANEHQQGIDGSLLSELAQLMDHLAEAGSLLLAGAGDEDHVTLHVTGGLVVLAVGHLPAEVGDKQGGVQNPAHDVVVKLGGGESSVAALVGEDPESGTEEALQESVQPPEDETYGGGGNRLGSDKVVEEIEGGG